MRIDTSVMRNGGEEPVQEAVQQINVKMIS